MTKKTDNDNLKSKLAIRRYFLSKYHTDEPIRVLDCCQGSGVIWNELRREYALASYWGIDKKKRKGRMTTDSIKILMNPVKENVIDIDTYGSPWKHWFHILPNIIQPVTVFLTIGLVKGPGGGQIDRLAMDSMGIPNHWNIRTGIQCRIAEISASYCLKRCCDLGILLLDAMESPRGRHARYIGVRIEPKGG